MAKMLIFVCKNADFSAFLLPQGKIETTKNTFTALWALKNKKGGYRFEIY